MKELLSLIIIVFKYCNFNIIAFIHVTNSYTPMKRMVQKIIVNLDYFCFWSRIQLLLMRNYQIVSVLY